MTSLKLLVSACLLATVALAGCSSTDHSGMPGMDSTAGSTASSSTSPAGSATPAAGEHNVADVTFASMMIPHHQQAVQMSDLLLTKRDIDPEVTDLATRIKAAQTPEITQMSRWLAGWGENPSPSAMGGMPGMDHGDGTMSQSELDALETATGEEATTLFLTGMIKHHRGAVSMAESELAAGQDESAKQLARDISSTQKAEITEMNKLLAG